MDLINYDEYSNNLLKLSNRIKREFKSVMYIGDIKINDDEYLILIRYMITACKKLFHKSSTNINDPVLATALVQFGIHEYDGGFWPHFKELFPMDNINQTHCIIIGKVFVYTLKSYNKKCLGYDKMVDSILMQSFITDYYSKSLFDFLLKYYELDLDRNLDNHTREMRDYLIYSMKRDDNLGRSYKIRRHTADAVTANERGCKIRIRRILKMIDDYMFYDKLPELSSNRVTRLFVEWARNSKDFDFARRKYLGSGKKGKKRFSSPYLKFNTDLKCFVISFPVQNIPLSDDELGSSISWMIEYNGISKTIEVETEESITGCKTIKEEHVVGPDNIFKEFRIELLKNDIEVVRKFVIRADEVRFFDDDWDSISIYDDFIPLGNCFAFCKGDIECICNSKEEVELCLGLNLYTLYLENGDVIKYPSGIARPVGREFVDGILPHNYIDGAYVIDTNNKRYSIFSSAPIINFTAEDKQIPGTLIWINGKKHILSDYDYMVFNYTSNGKKKGCILKMESFELEDGLYNVSIDIPGCKKDYSFEFSVIKKFEYNFIGAPYIFKNEGEINFSQDLQVESLDGEVNLINNSGTFDILEDYDELMFSISTKIGAIDICIEIPSLKWKFDDGDWNVAKPEPIWYQEFPDFIYLKCLDETVSFSMDTPEVLGINEEIEDDYRISFKKLKGTNIIECDTTKMKSWLGNQDAIRPLRMDFGRSPFVFLSICTKCILNDFDFKADYDNNAFIITGNIIGFADCYIDVYYYDEIIAEKVEFKTKGVTISSELMDGKYTVVFYEQDDEDDEFGFGEMFLQEFAKKIIVFENKFNFTEKRIVINKAIEVKKNNSIFAPETFTFSKKYYVDLITRANDMPLSFFGVLHDGSDYEVKVFFSILNAKNLNEIALAPVVNEKVTYFVYTKDNELSVYNGYTNGMISLKTTDYHFNISIK